jgi:hypothetical protein
VSNTGAGCDRRPAWVKDTEPPPHVWAARRYALNEAPIADEKNSLASISEYPFQESSSLNAVGINYNSLKVADALKRLKETEATAPA